MSYCPAHGAFRQVTCPLCELANNRGNGAARPDGSAFASTSVVGDGDALRTEIEVAFAKWWDGPVRMQLASCYSGHCAFKAGFLAGRRAQIARISEGANVDKTL